MYKDVEAVKVRGTDTSDGRKVATATRLHC